jgi:poly(3-hydroxybutyrate) depolymerase
MVKKSFFFLVIFFLTAAASLRAAGQEFPFNDFKLIVDGSSYNVISAAPTAGGEKRPLILYLHGFGRGGLGKYELRKLAKTR